MKKQREQREKKHKRIRAKISGTKSCPRLSVFRSSRHFEIQLIDDQKGKTLFGINDSKIKIEGKAAKIQKAKELGRLIAEKALAQGIKKAVFDRSGYKYHGRVKAAAEGAREAGLKF